MFLTDILNLKGLGTSTIKIVRHTLKRKGMNGIAEGNNLEIYQSYQKKDSFKGFDYIISFIGLEGTKSLLYGIYKVNGANTVKELPSIIEISSASEDWGEGPYFKYDLEKDDILSSLEGRLVIDWGGSTTSWHQKKLDKKIVEILPEGFVSNFPGYENIILSFEQLSKLINNPDSNRQWKMMLSNVYGIYLILDKTTGQQYVGSACGREGIWRRWSQYVKNKHGDNMLLKELLIQDPKRYMNFQFSILNVLPKSFRKEEVINIESLTKEKLGTRVFGLNAN